MVIGLGVNRRALIVCTSGTRPASPGVGQEIFETDTKNVLVWTGAAWAQPTPNALSLIGAAQTVTGASAPALGRPWFMQAGTSALITDASGQGQIGFPTPFPNDVIAVTAHYVFGSTGGGHDVSIGAVTTGHFYAATAFLNTTVPITWMALGY